MKKCLICGSFDPFTIGHLNMVKNACNDFDFVYIALGNYIIKRVTKGQKRMFDKKMMIKAINYVLEKNNITNAKCVDLSPKYFCGALRAKKLKCGYLVRGVRNYTDLLLEEKVAKVNNLLGCPTILYINEDKYSSTKFKKALANGDKSLQYLPDGLEEFLNNFKENTTQKENKKKQENELCL